MSAKTIPYRAVKVTKSDTAYITDQVRESVVESALLATAVDLTAETITYASHGFSDNDVVVITNSGTTDLSTSIRYYVKGSTTNTFQLSLTYGGSAVNIGGANTTPPTFQRISKLNTAAKITGSLFIGGAGDVMVLPEAHGDTDDPTEAPSGAVKFTVPAGAVIVGHFKKVFSTGTTATNIICQH